MTNFGNVVLNISWNASDMISQDDSWELNNTDFAVDDDTFVSEDTADISLSYLNASQNTFEPASGLLICTSDSCSDTNSTLNTYYHIYPPTGLLAGTYNTSRTTSHRSFQ